MSIAANLLRGSQLIDEWRKEIKATASMIAGFLQPEDLAHIALGEEVVVAEDEYHRWVLFKTVGDGTAFDFYDINREKTEKVCTLPDGNVPLTWIRTIHYRLDSLVEGLERLFPQLKRRWAPLLRATRSEFAFYYQLEFRVPAPDSEYADEREQGKLVSFRKKINTRTFPLPLGTEVFIGLEGEPKGHEVLVINGEEMFGGEPGPVGTNGDCFFEVVRYESQVLDSYGDLEERRFITVLRPQEGWEAVPSENHFEHLLDVNGWERDY